MNYSTQPSPGGASCLEYGSCVKITGSGNPKQALPSPSGIGRQLQRLFGMAPLAVPSTGKQKSEEGGCDVFIGRVTTAPENGFGTGEVTKVTFHSDGSWSTNGDTVTVIFPHI